MELDQSVPGREAAARGVDAQSRFSVAAPPAWVVHAPFDLSGETDDKFVSNGTCLLLRDHQVDFSGPEIAYHARMLWRVLTATGAAAVAQFSFPFDPLLQRLDVHAIRIHRGGEIIEHTRRDAFTLMRREQNLERLVLDGHVTVTMIVPDVRPGDVVENCWTLYERHPVLGNQACEYFPLLAPAIELRERLRIPTARKIAIKYFGTPAEPTLRQDGDLTEYTWLVTRNEAEKWEDFTPPWRGTARGLQVSEIESWADVSRRFAPHYTGAGIPPVLHEIAAAITASDPAARMMAALAAVQARLRYLSISLGEGGLIPRTLADTWASGYGDCKDSAVTFVALARLCGLDAVPALVSTIRGPALNDFLPSTMLFDHCIARVTIDGKRYWIDPTRRYQPHQAALLTNPHLGFALPITESGDGLEDMGTPEARTFLNLRETLVYGDKVSSPATLAVRMTFGALSGESVRQSIANDGLPSVAERVRNRYINEWPRIADAEPLTVEEDENDGTVTLVGRYTIAGIWTKTEDAKRVTSRIVDHSLISELGNLAQTDGRKTDIYLGFPRLVRRHCEVTMPKDWAVGETDTQIQIKGAVYSEKIINTDKRQFIIEQNLMVSAPISPPAEAKGYAEMARAMNNMPALVVASPISGDKFSGAQKAKKMWGYWVWAVVVCLWVLARILQTTNDGQQATVAAPAPQTQTNEPGLPPAQSSAPDLKGVPAAPPLDVKNMDWINRETQKVPPEPKKPQPSSSKPD
jgi:transglutaminase-like putative cysteine protease